MLITGANSGIGLATAHMAAAEGATLLMAARSVEKGQAAVEAVKEKSGNGNVELLQLDLASFASIRKAATEVMERHDRLEVLINNAGLILTERRTTEEGFEQTFGINHLGHFLLTNLLLDRLKASAPSRVINVASEAYLIAKDGLELDDLNWESRKFSGFRAYGESKLANIFFTRVLAKRLEGTGVVTHALHPGTIRSGFGKDGDTRGPYRVLSWLFGPFLKGPKAGAKVAMHCATSEEAGQTSGAYWVSSKNKTEKLKDYAKDEEAAERLWQLSEEFVARVNA